MSKLDFRTSVKHIEIDKAHRLMLIALSITTAIVIFVLVASVSLLKEMTYRNKVIDLRSKANQQLQTDIQSVNSLVKSYQTFNSSPVSIIATPQPNATVVLDALPSKYDFPALVTSLAWLVNDSQSTLGGISGTDNETTAAQISNNPQPISIPFQISSSGSFSNAQKLVTDLELSIRPIQISSLTLSGSDSNLQVSISAQTYYQPEKEFSIANVLVNSNGSQANGTTNGVRQ